MITAKGARVRVRHDHKGAYGKRIKELIAVDRPGTIISPKPMEVPKIGTAARVQFDVIRRGASPVTVWLRAADLIEHEEKLL